MQTRPTHPLNQSQLYKLRSRAKLARLLRITPAELRRLTAEGKLYTEFDVAKTGGTGSRRVEHPCPPLKRAQAKVARLLARVSPPDFLFCPVKRRCYVSNAAAHRGNRVVQCLDIKRFFPSTPQRRVFWFFHKVMKCERDIAGLLAELACYQGHLPTGSPLSPIIAYFAFYDLWQRIAAFCGARGYIFTVYIDDVTISGARVPKSDIWQVQQMIHAVGLRYHKEKTFIDRPAEVTGVVLRDGGKLAAPFRQHKKMHEARKLLAGADEMDRQALLGRVAGIEGQIRQIAAKD